MQKKAIRVRVKFTSVHVQSRYLDGMVARKKLLIPLKKIWLKMWGEQQKILEFLKNRNRNLRG